ncbi:biotin--[acetyl-CoA-carboxylase] ligase [Sulfurimonas sp. C5]|uniref:biotin--[acetyl-CoA-carboxylase] ligase n=1 Tax=Sulfurimonas sp. C5 TaxID=3036947 RepID=UPI0024588200|nr:biotin--[acetyl-CoA-carboxylase] ligase [Sulfurimonas sp. C5]MDH4943630.1 biotin--[acetyl-CoA-carboxylase] ligase [Sulfurimonas sp. C5]
MLQILYLDEVESTQTYLKAELKNATVTPPFAVSAELQTNGIGSRNNSWTGYEGNLFLSFVLPVSDLPDDLKVESASIYFAYLLKETLAEMGSKLFLKWPNDFYIDEYKIGGMITNVSKQNIICGVGINLIKAPEGFATIDIALDKKKLLEYFFKKVEKKISWKKVFRKYKLEFHNNQKFFTHIKNNKISLSNAVLEEDGSLNINGERIYSLR